MPTCRYPSLGRTRAGIAQVLRLSRPPQSTFLRARSQAHDLTSINQTSSQVSYLIIPYHFSHHHSPRPRCDPAILSTGCRHLRAGAFNTCGRLSSARGFALQWCFHVGSSRSVSTWRIWWSCLDASEVRTSSLLAVAQFANCLFPPCSENVACHAHWLSRIDAIGRRLAKGVHL